MQVNDAERDDFERMCHAIMQTVCLNGMVNKISPRVSAMALCEAAADFLSSALAMGDESIDEQLEAILQTFRDRVHEEMPSKRKSFAQLKASTAADRAIGVPQGNA